MAVPVRLTWSVSVKFVARAVVAVLLLLGVYVLALGLLVGIGLSLWQAVRLDAGAWTLVKLGLIALGIGGPVVVALWKVARTRPEEPSGLELPPDRQPVLWEEVRSMARTVGTRPPDEIRLIPEVNAMVLERARLLGLVAGRRVLYVGTPLVLGMTRQQLRSVLAHELGHYSHRHVRLAPVVYRGQLTVGHLVGALGEDTWPGKLFAAYGSVYLRVSGAISRRQESEADAWSQRVAGRDAAAAAMRGLVPLSGLWSFFLERYAFAVEGARPDALHHGFARLLDEPLRREQLGEHGAELPDEPTSPFDTHPSPASRVAWFESLPEDGVVDDGTPARGLLTNLDDTLLSLEAEVFDGSDLEPRSWDWLAHEAGRRRSRAGASMLVRASRERGAGAATLRDAVMGLSLGRAHSLVRPYVAIDTPPDVVDGAARRMVNDLVALGLVEHCRARFGVEWDGALAVVDEDGEPVDVAGLVAATVDEGSGRWLLTALEEEGLPSSYTVEVSEDEDLAHRAREAPVMQAAAACVQWRRIRIVVVAENALLVKRMGWRESLGTVGQGGRDAYERFLHHVAGTPLPQLLVDPRTEVHGWERIESARLTRRTLAFVADGRTHRFRVRRRRVLGDLPGALRDHLGRHAHGC